MKVVLDLETLFEGSLERLDTGAAGMNQRAVDIEQEQSLGCHSPD